MMSSSLALISCNAAFREGGEGRGRKGAKGGGISSKENMGRCTEKEGEGGGKEECGEGQALCCATQQQHHICGWRQSRQ